MIAAATVLSFACVGTVTAQWIYRNPSVPRTKDGKPDMNTPVPRTAWGTVDLSGVWQTDLKYNANLAADRVRREQPRHSTPGRQISGLSSPGAGAGARGNRHRRPIPQGAMPSERPCP